MTNRVVDGFLDVIIKESASDMFLTYDEYPALRINMKIHRKKEFNKFDDTTLNTIAKELIQSSSAREKFTKELNIDLSLEYKERRFRINVSKSQGHIMVVARLLMNRIPSLDEITGEKVIHDIIKKPS